MQGRAASGFPALRRCVGVDPKSFAEEYWSRRELHSPAATLPRDFTDLLDLDVVDELLSKRGLRTPFLRVAQGGSIRPAASYTRGGGAGADIADQVADDRVLDLFADGNTLVLQGLHRLWPPVVEFAAALRHEISHPVQVNAYLTPRASQGFAHHYDVHDVFVLQVAGRKHWQVHAPVFDGPLRTQPWTDHREAVARASRGAALIDTVLEAGDALYLPRGYIHGAQALDGVSAHLTVGVHSVTRYAIVEALLAEAANESALRTSLPLGIDLNDAEGGIGLEVAQTMAALRSWFDEDRDDAKETTTKAGDRLRRQVWAQSRPAPIAPIATAVAVSDLRGDSVLTVRPYLDLHLEHTADGVRVETGTQVAQFEPAAAPTLVALHDGAALSIADFPDLDIDTALDLAGRLLRSGITVLG